MTPSTVCYRCERVYGLDRARCDCGEPLWFESARLDWPDRREGEDGRGMWRYGDLLPVADPGGVAAAAGGTPLVRSDRLDDAAGCRVYVKDETGNPTGSYKDRGSAVAVTRAFERGSDAVGTVSYGNMAMSTAAHAASLGRECVVLVPAEISTARLELIAQYDPTVLGVEGDYGALYDEALALNDELPVAFLLSDAPGRVAGYRTALFEVYEQLSGVPDAIVVPASSGGFASGLWRGVLDLRAAGLVGDPPRLYLVQPAASDPITRAFERGDDEVSALAPDETGETVAHSVGNPDPPSGTRALTAARETGGAVLSVTDEEILEAKGQFARRGGFCVEPASATTLAGVAKLAERGDVGAGETAVLVPTGTGFKEMGTGETPVGREVVERTDLAARLDAVLAG